MNETLIFVVALFAFVTNGALFAWNVRDLVRRHADERAHLIDVIVAKHAGELRQIRSAPDVPAAVKDFRRELERDLEAMGYEPGSVPTQPHGF